MRNDELVERLIKSKEAVDAMIIHAETALEHDHYFKSLNVDRDVAAYRDAVLMQLGQVGEACSLSKFPIETKAEYDFVNWHALNGLRNYAYYRFPGLDYDLAWHIVDNVLEKLIDYLLNVANDLDHRRANFCN